MVMRIAGTRRTKCVHLKYHVPRQHGGREIRHSHSGYGRRGSVQHVVYFETKFGVGGHDDAVAVGQRQRFVVVQDGVQVFYPHRVHGTVQNDPTVFVRVHL